MLSPWAGPAWTTLLSEAPRFEPRSAETYDALREMESREARAEGEWDASLCQRVRSGEVSIEHAVSAAAAYAANRARHTAERARRVK